MVTTGPRATPTPRLLGPTACYSGQQIKAVTHPGPEQVSQTPRNPALPSMYFLKHLQTSPHLENEDPGPHIHVRRCFRRNLENSRGGLGIPTLRGS